MSVSEEVEVVSWRSHESSRRRWEESTPASSGLGNEERARVCAQWWKEESLVVVVEWDRGRRNSGVRV